MVATVVTVNAASVDTFSTLARSKSPVRSADRQEASTLSWSISTSAQPRHQKSTVCTRKGVRYSKAGQARAAKGGNLPLETSLHLPGGLQTSNGKMICSCGQRARKVTPVAATGSQVASSASSELVLCFGEMLIDFVPTVNGVSLAEAPAFQKAAGGAPANVAVGISRLGGNSAFLGKVGEDEFGHMLEEILRDNGVNTSAVRFDPGARTALAFVTLKADGEREFMFYRNPSADMLLESSELDYDLIRQASIVHYGSISLIAEPCRSAHVALMQAATEAGAILSYDPNLRMPLWPSADLARQEIRSIWDQADIIKVSEEEITFLTEGGDPYSDEAARALFHDNLRVLLVTEGSAGCRYYTKDFSGRVPGMSVKAVDATGAGDAFVAGFLSKLSLDLALPEKEDKLRDALFFANACGAIATTERGAIPALPDQEAVAALLSKVPA